MTGGYGEHHQEEKTEVARTRVAHGQGYRRANQVLHWVPG